MAGHDSAVFLGIAVATGALVGGVLAVNANTPSAVSASSGPTVISACVAKKGGALRVVRSSAKCTKKERFITFNQTGPQGPVGASGGAGQAGAPGEVGPTGPTGQTGSAGTSKVYINSTSGDVVPPMQNFAMPIAQLSLPKGSYALHGRLHFQLAGGSAGTCALWNITSMDDLGTVSVPVTGNVALLGAVTVTADTPEDVQIRCNFPSTSSAKDPVLQAIRVDEVVTQ